MYDPNKSWIKAYENTTMSYPAEGVIRIFKGTFPDLKMPKPSGGEKIVDIGCGDGRHLPLFQAAGMQVSGVEIADELTDRLREQMKGLDIEADLRTGHTGAIPFESDFFDYLLSWNSCYYMSKGCSDFQVHVDEMARVLKKDAWIVASIPKKDNFIFRDSHPHEMEGYRVIGNDYFNSRNGEVMRCMASREDLVQSFGTRFKNFCHADLDMDWFGLSYRWHVFVAQKS